MITEEKNYSAALYCRLSQDDGSPTESISIGTQKSLLTRYCTEQGFPIYDTYIDDGWSGTNFERPDFKRMISDIESGNVNLVIVKDLSRFGREYAMMGVYLNYTFEDYNVRFIAITDGVDTLINPDDLVMPIKNVVNAQYARECGRKTKAARTALAKDGKYIGSLPPYGYVRDPEDRHHLIPDETSASVVRRIFSLYCGGCGFRQIAGILRDEMILTPQSYSGFRTAESRKSAWRQKCDWHLTTVKSILQNEEYTGCVINCKEQVRGGSKKRRVDCEEENRIVVRGTHEPIITEEQFSLAQSMMKNKYRHDSNGEKQIFTGLVKCSTCGSGMNLSTSHGKKKSFACWVYRNYGKERCTSHRISYNALYSIVLNDIRTCARMAYCFRAQFYEMLISDNKEKNERETSDLIAENERIVHRIAELDTVLNKLYEDYALGKISEARHHSMTEAYESEREEKEKQRTEIEKKITQSKEKKINADKFFDVIRKYTDIGELSAAILNELIEKIVVYDKTEVDGQTVQNVVIYYKFVGVIAP